MPISDFGYSMTAHFLTIPKAKGSGTVKWFMIGVVIIIVVFTAAEIVDVFLLHRIQNKEREKFEEELKNMKTKKKKK